MDGDSAMKTHPRGFKRPVDRSFKTHLHYATHTRPARFRKSLIKKSKRLFHCGQEDTPCGGCVTEGATFIMKKMAGQGTSSKYTSRCCGSFARPGCFFGAMGESQEAR